MPALQKASLKDALETFAASNKTHVIVQRGDATGDIAHVTPVLSCRKHYAVLVVDNDGSKPTGLNQVANVYTDSFLIPQDQVIHILLPDIALGDLARKMAYNGTKKVAGKSLELLGLTSSTRDTVAELTGTGRGSIATTMRGPDYKAVKDVSQDMPNVEMRPITHLDDYAAYADGALRAFWKAKGVIFAELDRHYVILWARESPNHPELNSTPKMLDQLAEASRGKGHATVVAGAIKAAQKEGMAALSASVFLGEFWKDDHWKLGSNRAAQIRLFYILRQHLALVGHKAVHAGMRSGGLDAYGFAGEPIVYVIAKSKAGEDTRDSRMKPVVEALTKAPSPMPFGRVPISKEPSKVEGGGMLPDDLKGVMEKITEKLA